MKKTIFEKIWDSRVVKTISSDLNVLYIDTHLIHEVTSPQAFTGLDDKGLNVFRKNQTFATVDHNIPTKQQHLPIKDVLSKLQVKSLEFNCNKHDITFYGIGHENNGIVHVIGPENGLTQPGRTLVCGDSHTSTHGAFGCVAFGIGTTQVQQVFASQCIVISKPKTFGIEVTDVLQKGVTAKDLVLYIINKVGANGGAGHFIEFYGTTISDLSMEERMTVCNMSIEMGSRGGLIAPDDKTYDYLEGKPNLPKGRLFEKQCDEWSKLITDQGARFDKKITIDASVIEPMFTFGTSPDQSISINETISSNEKYDKALKYMKFNTSDSLIGKEVNYVFIGSCTNSRIEDIRAAANIVKGKTKAKHVNMWVVPGSQKVLKQAQDEGLVDIFKAFGAEFRSPGCSACLAMNDDKIPSGALCISTSNRNFEGRQGKGARTILASPISAAAAAITGEIIDPRKYL
jgi:3-isopropylmalate/(R)-2-methylmalate dehydratase large subunit